MMKQAIQLEIPFDGQALTAATPVAGSSQVKSIPTDAAELRVLAAVRRAAGTALAAVPSLKLAAQAGRLRGLRFRSHVLIGNHRRLTV